MMTLDIDTYEPDLASFLPIRSIAFSNTSSEARDEEEGSELRGDETADVKNVHAEQSQVPNVENDAANTFESSPTSIAGDMDHVFMPVKKGVVGRTTNSVSGGGSGAAGPSRVRV